MQCIIYGRLKEKKNGDYEFLNEVNGRKGWLVIFKTKASSLGAEVLKVLRPIFVPCVQVHHL